MNKCKKCGGELETLTVGDGVIVFCPRCVPEVRKAFLNVVEEDRKEKESHDRYVR